MTAERFIRARLADLDSAARAATELPQPITKYPEKRKPWEPERWTADQYGSVVTVNGAADPIIDADYGGGGVRSEAVAKFIVMNDPATAIQHAKMLEIILEEAQRMISTAANLGDDHLPAEFIIEALASMWPDHPDYDQAWKPWEPKENA